MMRKQSSHQRGQSLIEYALLLVIVAAAFLAMSVFLKRGVSGRIRDAAERQGQQWDARDGSYTTVTRYDNSAIETTTNAGSTTTGGINNDQNVTIDETITASDQLF